MKTMNLRFGRLECSVCENWTTEVPVLEQQHADGSWHIVEGQVTVDLSSHDNRASDAGRLAMCMRDGRVAWTTYPPVKGDKARSTCGESEYLYDGNEWVIE